MTQQPMSRTSEIERRTISGYVGLGIGLALLAAAVFFILNVGVAGPQALLIAAPLFILGAFVLSGLYMLQPNEAAILLLFGAYKGTDRMEGLHWANPFYKKQKISLRAHNLASDRLKVNDKRGNPIEIAAAIVAVRDGKIAITPGYDGVYGVPQLANGTRGTPQAKPATPKPSKQNTVSPNPAKRRGRPPKQRGLDAFLGGAV